MTNDQSKIIEELMLEFAVLRDMKRLTTSEVRKISAKTFKKLPKDQHRVLDLCERLLEQRIWEMTITAYDWAYRMRKNYDESTFNVFENWMHRFIVDWWDCDDFCTHAFGELMIKYPQLLPQIIKWCESDNFAVRRCAAVILILPIKRKVRLTVDPFEICDRLKSDPHYLVLKGYGWMLKVLSSMQYDKVLNYLESNQSKMPRIAFRYALEKMKPSDRRKLMNQ